MQKTKTALGQFITSMLPFKIQFLLSTNFTLSLKLLICFLVTTFQSKKCTTTTEDIIFFLLSCFSKGLFFLPLCTTSSIKQIFFIFFLLLKDIEEKIVQNLYSGFPPFILHTTCKKNYFLFNLLGALWIRNSPCGVKTTYLGVVSTWGLLDCTEKKGFTEYLVSLCMFLVVLKLYWQKQEKQVIVVCMKCFKKNSKRLTVIFSPSECNVN